MVSTTSPVTLSTETGLHVRAHIYMSGAHEYQRLGWSGVVSFEHTANFAETVAVHQSSRVHVDMPNGERFAIAWTDTDIAHGWIRFTVSEVIDRSSVITKQLIPAGFVTSTRG